MGPTGAGKSTCYRILSRIMTSLHKAGSKNEQYQEVAFEILNPKCITMGELYGPWLGVPQWCLHVMNRLQERRSGLVSFSSLEPFGPRDKSARCVNGRRVASMAYGLRARRDAVAATPSPRRA